MNHISEVSNQAVENTSELQTQLEDFVKKVEIVSKQLADIFEEDFGSNMWNYHEYVCAFAGMIRGEGEAYVDKLKDSFGNVYNKECKQGIIKAFHELQVMYKNLLAIAGMEKEELNSQIAELIKENTEIDWIKNSIGHLISRITGKQPPMAEVGVTNNREEE